MSDQEEDSSKKEVDSIQLQTLGASPKKIEKLNDGSSSSDESGEEEADIEDQYDDEYEAKASPYHLIGFCCFCSSIIVGIICVLVSSLLASNSSTSNESLKFIWGGLFAAFITFLFLCLCCTYYLGASKESWEVPTFSGIRRNFSNFVALAGLVVEFIQICSFSFNRTRKFSGMDLSYINYIAVPAGEDNDRNDPKNFEIVYWTFFVVAFTPYIFVIIIRVLIYVYTIKKGESAAANLVEKHQEKIHSVLWFLVNALYFPVIGTMVAGTDCTFYDDRITLDAETEILCLEGKHIGILICSMLALIIYYPAASFAQAQTQSISDIKFKPRIVFIMLQGKFAISLIGIFFTSSYYVYYSGLLVINVGFLVINLLGRPCLVQWVNRMRTAFFAMALWATICSGIVGTWILDDEESPIPVALLLSVWGLMAIGFPLFFYFYSKFKPQIENGSITN